MKTLRLVFAAFRDLLIQKGLIRPKKPEKAFAFIIHPRDLSDVARKYPFTRYFPSKFIEIGVRFLWPIVGSKITGLKDEQGNEVPGWIVICPLSAKQLLKNKKLGKKRILQTVRLAERLGAQIVGLGAFTSSTTDGGKDIVDHVNSFITNGNSFVAGITAADIDTLRKNHPLENITIAIVGATGSIGSAVSKMLAKRKDFNSLILIGKTPAHTQTLERAIQALDDHINTKVTTNIEEIINADIIVVATSAKEAIIYPSHLKQGAIVYDITQPRNTSDEVVTKRKDVILIDGGLVHTPGINYHFDFGIPKESAFGCLAETMILAAAGIQKNYSIGNVRLESVDKISRLAKKFRFHSLFSHSNFDS